MKTAIALSGLIGLLLAQVGIKLPPEKLEKAYLYELVVEPLGETKIPPPPPSPERVREAFLKKWAFWS